jgi:hypothetical protein
LSDGPQPRTQPDSSIGSFDDIKKHLQETESTLVDSAQLTIEQQKSIQDRLYRMIEYAVRRHDWYVDQCHRLLQIGVALIATAAAIGSLLGKIETLARSTQYFAWVLALSIFGTGIYLVYLYNSFLSSDHPYRKVVDIYSWYFKYLFPQEPSPKVSKGHEIATNQIAQEAARIKSFFEAFLGRATKPLSSIREDIEQVAILFLLQGYRLQQVKRMQKALFRGLVLGGFVFMCLIGSSLFARHPTAPNPVSSTVPPVAAMPALTIPCSCPQSNSEPPPSQRPQKSVKSPQSNAGNPQLTPKQQ